MMKIKAYECYPQQEDYKADWIKKEDYDKVLCNKCNRILINDYFNENLKIQKMKYDFITVSYGGGYFISEKVKKFIIDQNYTGIVLRKMLNMNIYQLICTKYLKVRRDLLDSLEKCSKCGEYLSVSASKAIKIINNKTYSKLIEEKVDDEFYFTDLKFGEHMQKTNILIIGKHTFFKIKKAKLKGLVTIPIIE